MIVFVVFLNGQTTTWNGTSWSNGVPSANVDAIIAGNYNVVSNVTARNFTINSNQTYTIDDYIADGIDKIYETINNVDVKLDDNFNDLKEECIEK